MDKQTQAAWIQQMEQHKGILLKICHAYCSHPQDREDLIQEMLLQLWKSAGTFNGSAKFSTWMYRVVLNVAISYYRKKETQLQSISIDEVNLALADHTNAQKETETQIRLLQQFIHELKPLDRALMILYLEAKTYAEIGYIIGISTTNVATKINRIKQQLKQKFNQIKD
jgi:RNA polymerase sigma-70 factor (ECF subfamily)